MDSLTQAALGATVAYAVSGRRLGRKALIAGALVGTLPDMDVLVPFDDAVDNFTYHRSWSHSYLTLTLITPVLAWLLAMVLRMGGGKKLPKFRNLLWMVWLVLLTHVLLDSFTVYGTQVFWPLSNYPVGWGSIFIIDPLFTLPLLLAAIKVCRSPVPVVPLVNTALAISVCYLLLTVWVQQTVLHKARDSLTQAAFEADAMSVLPSPGSLLWRVVARNENQYLEGFYSIFDNYDVKLHPIGFTRHDAGEELLQPLNDYAPVQRLRWFTKGLYATDWQDGKLLVSDLRMGIEAQYVFRFEVGSRQDDGSTTPARPTVVQRFEPDLVRMRELLSRIFRDFGS